MVWHRENEARRKLERIPGIGPLTASELVASMGEAKSFDNGRQLAAWLGLVPRQHPRIASFCKGVNESYAVQQNKRARRI